LRGANRAIGSQNALEGCPFAPRAEFHGGYGSEKNGKESTFSAGFAQMAV
jgi:hypothetical protein